MNRKGLSPLQSTVILLVISIIIGIVVMSWGKSYVEQATKTAQTKAAKEQQASVFEDLDARLHNGEITQQQYNEIKAVLITQQG